MTEIYLHPFDLQCEYLTDPLGVDVQLPRFSWKLSAGARRGQKQTAYQVLVASSPALLNAERGDVWDSGRVASSQSVLVPFGGQALVSNQTCFWKVRFWDKDEQPSAWSETARFAMGLLVPEDWRGAWIRHSDAASEKHLWFRKSFSLNEKPNSAFVHVASLGYHELYVNGQKADDRVLAPALSRLDKRVLYVSYDLAALLQGGENALALWTGPGWSRYDFFQTHFALRVQLNADNFSLASDASWRCEISSSENLGGCQYKDNGGEMEDARRFIPDWNAVAFDESAWSFASETAIDAALCAQMMEPTLIIETLVAPSVSGDGPFQVDMGRNFTGWIEVDLRDQNAGDEIVVKVADGLDETQDFGQKSVYLCNGAERETFCNRFNFVAGRYVTVEGLKTKPQPGDIRGHALATDLKRVGHFRCSSELLNQIYETDLWTYRANTTEGYTSDCPHRERLGYGEVAFATAWGIGLPNYASGAFYLKNVRDWADVQEESGWIHHTAPQINSHFGGPLWSSAGLNIAWEFYQTFGDTRVLEATYDSSRRWLEFLARHVEGGLLQNYAPAGDAVAWGKFLGDWAAPEQRKERGDTPAAQFFNNCVYAMNLATFRAIADILGQPGDAALYGERLEALKPQVHQRFFQPQTASYCEGTQVQQAFALLTGIVPEPWRDAVFANLEKNITQTKPYLDMGSSGLPVLLSYLIENAERADLLLAPLLKTNEPSYGHFLARGETTWPEYWNVDVPSRIHTCYTGIAAFFIKSLAGIRPDPAHPGCASFLIKPCIVGDLTWAEAQTQSLYGPIASRWEKRDGQLHLSVTVPANSTATVWIPSCDIRHITESGQRLSDAEAVTRVESNSTHGVVKIGAGNYEFCSTIEDLAVRKP